MAKRETLYLLDGMALAYRSFFAFINRPLINSRGENTSAIYGFVTTLMRILDDEHPDHIAVVFDTKEPTFRHIRYPAYKATREKMPEAMASSLEPLKTVVRAFRTPLLELPGFEADDLIGTLARRAEREGVMTFMVTADKDYMQLISPLIKMYRPGKSGTDREIVEEAGVAEKFGVRPDQVIDVLALMGDASDNVPGVPGVGEKTAIPLIQQHGSLDELYARLAEIPQKGLREKLTKGKDSAYLSRELVTIKTDVPLAIDFHTLRSTPPDTGELRRLFTELEFRSLASKIGGGKGAAPAAAGPEAPPAEEAPDEDSPAGEEAGSGAPAGAEAGSGAKAGPGAPADAAASGPVTDVRSDEHTYRTITTKKELAELAARLKGAPAFVFDTETTSTDALRARLIGLSFSLEEREAYYVPVRTLAVPVAVPVAGTGAGAGAGGGGTGLFDAAERAQSPAFDHTSAALDVNDVLRALRPALESASIGKIGQNLKYDILVLSTLGVSVRGVLHDTMIASYILRADGQHNLDALALEYFRYRMVSFEDLVGKGKAARPICEVPLEAVAEYSAEDADLTLRVYNRQKAQLEELGQTALCTRVEFPLIEVLVRMESAGIPLDIEYLRGMSKELERQLEGLVGAIHQHAGETFNINSTQQLAAILFTRLHLPPIRKTKTGYSTDVGVLEALRTQHPIVEHLLEYRQLAKLKSTYVDALPELVHPRTGRVHTSFNQAVAATGRLSSSDPNLQNIPIRTEMGSAIRKAFVARGSDVTLLSADYSQIELRIMAHISGDEGLRSAFLKGEDVHTTTAAGVFGIAAEDVTKEMRRRAKEVNFGIMYGIGPFGLGNRLGIAQSEAKEIISRYFARFPKVKEYITKTIEGARKTGYVETLLGRRRYLPDLASRNQAVRGNAERAAINMPIQGTAADMIKLAMIGIDEEFRSRTLASRMLLQVHDELVFEVPGKEKSEVEKLVREKMQTALRLDVPIVVEAGFGSDWLAAH